jgi:hypothetical protein
LGTFNNAATMRVLGAMGGAVDGQELISALFIILKYLLRQGVRPVTIGMARAAPIVPSMHNQLTSGYVQLNAKSLQPKNACAMEGHRLGRHGPVLERSKKVAGKRKAGASESQDTSSSGGGGGEDMGKWVRKGFILMHAVGEPAIKMATTVGAARAQLRRYLVCRECAQHYQNCIPMSCGSAPCLSCYQVRVWVLVTHKNVL